MSDVCITKASITCYIIKICMSNAIKLFRTETMARFPLYKPWLLCARDAPPVLPDVCTCDVNARHDEHF